MPSVNSGQTSTVSAGTTINGWSVASGGTLEVYGSSADNGISGTQNVFDGGVVNGTTVYTGGLMTISSGAGGIGTTVVGTEIVEAGGTEAGPRGGGQLFVYGVVTAFRR